MSFAAWITFGWAHVDAVHQRKCLQLLSLPKSSYLWALFKNMLQWTCYVFIFPLAPGGTQHAYGPYASSWEVLQAPSR